MYSIDDKYWLIICCFALLLVMILNTKQKMRKSDKKKLKELKWGKRNEVHGVIFGRKGKKVMFSPVEAEGSVLCTAGTGMGKTSSLLIPTLRSWVGTSLTIDISGDISRNCPNLCNKVVFEVENPDTTPYNIFAVIDSLDSDDEKNEALSQLAILLMPLPPNAPENAKFFNDNGRKILTASLICFYHNGMDFTDICRKIVGSSWQDLFTEIDQSGNENAIIYINGFHGASEQNTSGCYQSACEAISLFATNVKVRNSVRRPGDNEGCVEPKNIEKNNIFAIVPEEKLELFSPLLNIIVSQFMNYVSSRKVDETSKTILLSLDEYASLRIDSGIILDALRRFRKRKCRLLILTQNLADFDILYGENVTRAILSNLRFKLLLGGLGELKSMEEFSKMIGYKETTKRSVSRSASGMSRTESEDKEYVIEPSELDRMGDKAILIAPEGYFILKKNFYFKK